MHLTDNVAQSLGLNKKIGQRFGIELEYENWRGPRPVMKYWNLVRDGSLRNNGMEFVSAALSLTNLPVALKEAQAMLAKQEVEANTRCGVHVHVNMTDSTWAELWNFVVIYTLLEPRIFNQFAPGRMNNHFCVPTFSNTALIALMLDDVMALRNNTHMPEPRAGLKLLGANKYCAMNFSRLKDIGTVEIRIAPATTNMETVREWTLFLSRIQQAAKDYEDPLDIIADYEAGGIITLCEITGLKNSEVDPIVQEDAEDAATFMCGYQPPNWRDLDWQLLQAEDEDEDAMPEGPFHVDMGRIDAVLRRGHGIIDPRRPGGNVQFIIDDEFNVVEGE